MSGSTILTEIEGMEKSDDIFFIAATNNPWNVDSAFLSRFSKYEYIPPPDFKGRKEILKYHLKGVKFEDTNIDELGKLMEGQTGRSIKHIVQEVGVTMIEEKNPWLQDITEVNEKKKIITRPLTKNDFLKILKHFPPMQNKDNIKFEEFRKKFKD